MKKGNMAENERKEGIGENIGKWCWGKVREASFLFILVGVVGVH